MYFSQQKLNEILTVVVWFFFTIKVGNQLTGVWKLEGCLLIKHN